MKKLLLLLVALIPAMALGQASPGGTAYVPGAAVTSSAPVAAGCGSISANTGGYGPYGYAGIFTCGTGAAPATVTLTMPYAAPHGWVCDVDDQTNNTHISATTGGTATTCVVKGTIATSDVVQIQAAPY